MRWSGSRGLKCTLSIRSSLFVRFYSFYGCLQCVVERLGRPDNDWLGLGQWWYLNQPRCIIYNTLKAPISFVWRETSLSLIIRHARSVGGSSIPLLWFWMHQRSLLSTACEHCSCTKIRNGRNEVFNRHNTVDVHDCKKQRSLQAACCLLCASWAW